MASTTPIPEVEPDGDRATTSCPSTRRSGTNLQFMDQTAIALCRENRLPIVVFDMGVPGNIHKVVVGERVGTAFVSA